MKRRSFLSAAGIAGLAGLAPKSTLGSAPSLFAGESKTILKIGPYLQDASPNQAAVCWITNTPCCSWVEFGETAEQLDKKAQTEMHGFVQANNTVHRILLQGLQPGRKYFYRICSKAIEKFEPYKLDYGDTFSSKTFTFETPSFDAETASFLVFNDIHDRPESFPHLLQFAGPEKRDFILLNGDMFNYQTDEDQLVDHLLKPLSSVSAQTPFILSRGNHETRGKFARQLPDYFGGAGKPLYFSFQCGPVYAIVLDSGEDKEDTAPVYAGIVNFDNYRLEQAEWLRKEVQKKEFRKAKYKIVFSHIPLYYSGDWHGTMHCRKVWGPILNDAKIDLLISGHTHRYGVHQPVKGEHNYPIVIGGGPKDGKRTIIKAIADNRGFRLDMLDDSGKNVGDIRL